MQIFSFFCKLSLKNTTKQAILINFPNYFRNSSNFIRTQPTTKPKQNKKKKTEYKTRKLKLYVRTYPYPDFRANNAKINFREKEKKVLDQILGAGKYDARIRPSGINGTGEHSSLTINYN